MDVVLTEEWWWHPFLLLNAKLCTCVCPCVAEFPLPLHHWSECASGFAISKSKHEITVVSHLAEALILASFTISCSFLKHPQKQLRNMLCVIEVSFQEYKESFHSPMSADVSLCAHMEPPYTPSHLQPSHGVKLWLQKATSGKEIPNAAGISP